MKKTKNVIFWTVTVLMFVAILGFTVPKLFGIQFRAVTTGSMEPELPVGCMVIIVPKPFEKISVGDDIAFVANEKLTVVTHRVAKIQLENKSFVTRGIANSANDPKEVKQENVIGKVEMSINNLGYVVSWFVPLQNKIIAICVIVAIVACSLLLTGESDKRKARQGADENE